jgi:hypothetical protein
MDRDQQRRRQACAGLIEVSGNRSPSRNHRPGVVLLFVVPMRHQLMQTHSATELHCHDLLGMLQACRLPTLIGVLQTPSHNSCNETHR